MRKKSHKTTNQVVLYTTKKKEQCEEDGREVTKTIIRNLVQCRGCDFIALQNINTYSREIDGEEIITEHSFICPEEEEEYEDDRFLSYEELELLSKTVEKISWETLRKKLKEVEGLSTSRRQML